MNEWNRVFRPTQTSLLNRNNFCLLISHLINCNCLLGTRNVHRNFTRDISKSRAVLENSRIPVVQNKTPEHMFFHLPSIWTTGDSEYSEKFPSLTQEVLHTRYRKKSSAHVNQEKKMLCTIEQSNLFKQSPGLAIYSNRFPVQFSPLRLTCPAN